MLEEPTALSLEKIQQGKNDASELIFDEYSPLHTEPVDDKWHLVDDEQADDIAAWAQ